MRIWPRRSLRVIRQFQICDHSVRDVEADFSEEIALLCAVFLRRREAKILLSSKYLSYSAFQDLSFDTSFVTKNLIRQSL